MSNYTSQNLISIPSSQVPAGTLAMKVGDDIFTAGHPEPEGGDTPAASMDFYKCSYVNSDSWGGYKAVLNNGVYSFQSDSTEGLIYGLITPQTGGIYNSDVSLQVDWLSGIPSSLGLFFYASLNGKTPNTAQTGQSLVTTGTMTYQTFKGVPCCASSNDNQLQVNGKRTSIDPGVPMSFSFWVYFTSMPSNDVYYFTTQSTGGFVVHTTSTGATELQRRDTDVNDYPALSFGTLQTNTWYHLAATQSGDQKSATAISYVNGVQVATKSYGTYSKATTGIDSSKPGLTGDGSPYNVIGYMSSIRIYNRTLSKSEVMALSKEFTPTA